MTNRHSSIRGSAVHAAPATPEALGRMVVSALWVGGLILAGMAFAFRWGARFPELSFSAVTSMVYVPIAAVLIVLFGTKNFPLAASLYFGYLGIGQQANVTYFVTGDFEAALTLEELLAIPLITSALLGRKVNHLSELPFRSRALLCLIAISGVVSTGAAQDPGLAVAALFAKILIPMVVCLVCFLRLGTIEDYKVLWTGLLVGLVAVAAFGFRRAIGGDETGLTAGINQRFIGGGLSYFLACIYVMGGMLWLAQSGSRGGSKLAGIVWFLVLGMLFLLMWLGAHRGPLLFSALLFVWWLVTCAAPGLMRGRGLLLWLVGGGAAIYAFKVSLARTNLDTHLALERLTLFLDRGVQGESRWDLWMIGWDLWKQSPLVGIGLNNWLAFDTGFVSVHSSLFGLLIDVGVVGMLVFFGFFAEALWRSLPRNTGEVSHEDRQFLAGCRAGWVVTLLALMVELPFTSGQPSTNLFSYVVFLFPLLVFVAGAQRGRRTSRSFRNAPTPPSLRPQFTAIGRHPRM